MNGILSREDRTVTVGDTAIAYELQRKWVKNTHLHVRNGRVWVSASPRTPVETIEQFIRQKTGVILRALADFPKTEPITPEAEQQRRARCVATVTAMCRDFYGKIPDWGIPFPTIRFRKMSSRWGSCNPAKGILTFSTALGDLPAAFVEYVVVHEFVHLRVANHSKAFYREVARYLPDYKVRKALPVKCPVDKP